MPPGDSPFAVKYIIIILHKKLSIEGKWEQIAERRKGAEVVGETGKRYY